MARLSPVDPDDPALADEVAGPLRLVRQFAGRDYNVYLTIANHPGLLQATMSFGSAAYAAATLTPVQRELAYLSASVTNGCHY